jgi:hypothetical protein
MKFKIFLNLIFISIILVIFSSSSISQNCKKAFKMCKPEDLADFEYASQTSYANLSPGDTARVKIVVYSSKQYRVLLCSDPDLQQLSWRIVKINRKENKSFTVKLGDTTWTTEESFEEIQIFDSKNKNYWESNITESGRLYIDIYVPPAKDLTNKIETGCVGVFVGTKLVRSKENKGKGFSKAVNDGY